MSYVCYDPNFGRKGPCDELFGLVTGEKVWTVKFYYFCYTGCNNNVGKSLVVRGQLVNAAARYSEAWTNSMIRQKFQDNDFAEGLTVNRYNDVDAFFRNNVLTKEIKRVKYRTKMGE